MKLEELHPNLLVQTPDRRVLKVSTIYETRVTAQVVYPIPGRTTVQEFTADEVELWREPSSQMIHRYEDAWGFSR